MKVTRIADGVIRTFGGTAFLIPISGTTAGASNAFELNTVAQHIWKKLPLREAVNSEEIVSELLAVFDTDRAALEADVDTFFAELARLDLVEKGDEA